MPFKSPKQPYCRVCGKPIAKWTGTVWIEELGSIPKQDIGEYWRHVKGRATTKEECRQFTNKQIVSVKRGNNGTICSFGEWDGESYKDEYFCSGPCVRKFAYMVAALYPNVVTKQYNEEAHKRAAKAESVL